MLWLIFIFVVCSSAESYNGQVRTKRGVITTLPIRHPIGIFSAFLFPLEIIMPRKEIHHYNMTSDWDINNEKNFQEKMAFIKEYVMKRAIEITNPRIASYTSGPQKRGQQTSRRTFYNRGDGTFKEGPSSNSGAPAPPTPPTNGPTKPTPASKRGKASKKPTKKKSVVVLNTSVDVIDLTKDDEIHINVLPSTSYTLTTFAVVPPQSTASSSDVVFDVSSTESEESGDDNLQNVLFTESRQQPFVDIHPEWRDPIIARGSEWFPVQWGKSSSSVTNTCHIDSFLSHIVYLARSRPGYFRVNLNRASSHVENTLVAIAELAVRPPRNPATSFSDQIHRLWVLGSPTTFPALEDTETIDIRSDEHQSVFGPLHHSSLLLFLHQCNCGTTGNKHDKKKWTPAQLESFGSSVPVGGVSLITKKEEKRCKTCKVNFKFDRVLVPETTWIHSFDVQPGHTHDEFPTVITFYSIESGEPVLFDLAYISYGSRGPIEHGNRFASNILLHHVSVHRIGSSYRFFDGMIDRGALRLVPSSIDGTYEMRNVVYIRRDVRVGNSKSKDGKSGKKSKQN